MLDVALTSWLNFTKAIVTQGPSGTTKKFNEEVRALKKQQCAAKRRHYLRILVFFPSFVLNRSCLKCACLVIRYLVKLCTVLRQRAQRYLSKHRNSTSMPFIK